MVKRKKDLADRLVAIQKALNLKAYEFAKRLDTTPGFVSELESGKRMPGHKTLYSLKDKLDVNIDWLFTGIGPMFQIDKSIEGTSDGQPSEVDISLETSPEYSEDLTYLTDAVVEIMRSDNTVMKKALKENITAFHHAVKKERDTDAKLEGLKKDVKELQRRVEAQAKALNRRGQSTKSSLKAGGK